MPDLANTDWQHLHFFLAVARHGSARRAALALGCHYTSVMRRIAALESNLGARLFAKSPGGYTLTDVGRDILRHADQMDSEMHAISRKLQGADQRIEGELRITMTTTLAAYLLVDTLRDFADAYPGISLTLTTDSKFADLERGEAHVAVRASNSPGDTLVGRRFATYYEAIYATPDYLASHQPDRADTPARWLHWIKPADFQRARAKSEFPHVALYQQISDEVLMLQATRADMGIATLPCLYADAMPDLVRISKRPPEPCLDIWLLTHRDLVHNARVRAFMDFFGTALELKQPLLAGEKT